MPASELVRSFLAGLARESADPDAADAREELQRGRIEDDDYLIPPRAGGLDAEPDATADAPHPDGDALALAMLEVVVPALELGADPTEALDRLRERFDAVHKAFDESKHPRGKNGRFIGKDRIDAAKSNPALAKQLRKEVKPEDAHKLEAALSGEYDAGRTKRGQAKHEAGSRRQAKAETKAKADALISKLSDYHAKPGSVELTPEDLHALADHLPGMRVEDLRRARMALRASFKGNRRKEGMVEALVAHAKGMAFDARLAEQGITGADADEMRAAAGLDGASVGGDDSPPTPEAEPVAPAKKPTDAERIDAELSDADRRDLEAGPQPGPGDREEFVDTSAHAREREEAAQDRADRMAQWAANKPQSVQAQEVARAAQAKVGRLRKSTPDDIPEETPPDDAPPG